MPFTLRLLIFASLLILPFFANGAMNLIESMLSAPKLFRLTFPDGKIPEPLAEKYKVPPETPVQEVMLVGTFNDWGSKQSLDYLIEGVEGYPLEKVASRRWETKVQLPPGNYFYKFKFRLPQKVYPDWLWTEDLTNPKKAEDRFGGYNSILKVKSIKKFKTAFNWLWWSILAIFFLRYLLYKLIRRLMLLEISLAGKFLSIATGFILLAGTLLFFTFLFAGAKLFKTIDTQIANFLYNATYHSIVDALRTGKSAPPQPENPFWKMTRRLMDNQSPETYSLRDVDITWAMLYDAEGNPLLMGASENHTTWLAAHPALREKLLNAVFSKKPVFAKLAKDLTYAFYDWNNFELILNDSVSPIKSALQTVSLILKTRKLIPFNSFVYKIKTARKTYGYLLIFSFRNLKSYLMKNLSIATLYSFLVIFCLALLLVFVTIQQLLIPLKSLSRRMESVESGDLSARTYFKTGDEIGRMGKTFNQMVESLKEKEAIKEILGKYVSPIVAKQILKNPNLVKLSGEQREVTVLYADVRNFTPYAEKNEPEKVLLTLNEYFSVMIETISNFDGTIDKFIGDCVMAIFGAPLMQNDHSERAARCAWELKVRLQKLTEERKRKGESPLEIGIGLNSGSVVAGNLGSEKRTEYTVIGDTVNLAYRLKDIAKGGQILMGPQTVEQLRGKVKVLELEPQKLKGKSEPIPIYELLEVRS